VKRASVLIGGDGLGRSACGESPCASVDHARSGRAGLDVPDLLLVLRRGISIGRPTHGQLPPAGASRILARCCCGTTERGDQARRRSPPQAASVEGPPRMRRAAWIKRAKRTTRRGRTTPPRGPCGKPLDVRLASSGTHRLAVCSAASVAVGRMRGGTSGSVHGSRGVRGAVCRGAAGWSVRRPRSGLSRRAGRGRVGQLLCELREPAASPSGLVRRGQRTVLVLPWWAAGVSGSGRGPGAAAGSGRAGRRGGVHPPIGRLCLGGL
jgi:hypothetical protein